jgi:hypothetical protein
VRINTHRVFRRIVGRIEVEGWGDDGWVCRGVGIAGQHYRRLQRLTSGTHRDIEGIVRTEKSKIKNAYRCINRLFRPNCPEADPV